MSRTGILIGCCGVFFLHQHRQQDSSAQDRLGKAFHLLAQLKESRVQTMPYLCVNANPDSSIPTDRTLYPQIRDSIC